MNKESQDTEYDKVAKISQRIGLLIEKEMQEDPILKNLETIEQLRIRLEILMHTIGCVASLFNNREKLAKKLGIHLEKKIQELERNGHYKEVDATFAKIKEAGK